MLHTIKRGPAVQSGEPVDLLLACHGRIRSFLAMALRLAHEPELPRAVRSDGAAAVRRYFTVALPLHEEDEERSIAPRLRQTSAKSAVDDALGAMVAQHGAAHELLAVLDPKWASLSDPGGPSNVPGLADPTRALEALLVDHLAMEEARIIPAISLTLSTEERSAILEEMRGRRTGPSAWRP